MVKEYTVYFDASGQPHENDVLCVTGFGSTAKKWLRFESLWNALLKESRISPPFHATDFHNRAKQYAGWTNDQSAMFIRRAISILKTTTHKSFSAAMSVKDVRRMQREYVLMRGLNIDPPYTWCAMVACRLASGWLARHGSPSDPVRVIFERGDQDQGLFLTRWREVFP